MRCEFCERGRDQSRSLQERSRHEAVGRRRFSDFLAASAKVDQTLGILLLIATAFFRSPPGWLWPEGPRPTASIRINPSSITTLLRYWPKPGMKIVSAYVAVGNRLDTVLPLPWLTSPYGTRERQACAEHYCGSHLEAASSDQAVAPQAVVGGYISWEVPFYAWPMFIDFGSGERARRGWKTSCDPHPRGTRRSQRA